MENQNKEVTEEIKRELGLSELTGYPRKVADAILPIVDVSKKKYINVIKLRQTTGTILTTSSTKCFYLVGITQTAVNDGAGAISENIVGATLPSGDTQVFHSILVGKTACFTDSMLFNPPILLAKASPITCVLAGATNRTIVFGYEVDNVGD